MKKILAIVTAFSIVAFNGFVILEGLTAGAAADVSQNWDVLLEVTDELAYSCTANGGDIDLGQLSGFTGGVADDSTTCTITTNNQAGWEVTIEASDNGTMVSENSDVIAAYASSTPEAWVLDSTDNSYYGYYASSTEVVAGYGVDLYRDLTTAPVLVAEDTAETASTGLEIDFGFKVQLGSTAGQPSGNYVSTVTSTASTK
jgi:hypothetical protein